MKLRIMGNSLRLRLSQSEVELLGKEGLVNDSTNFPLGNRLTYEIKVSDSGEIECHFTDGLITIEVPEPVVNEWVNTEMVGFDHGIILENSTKLSILVEKDFKCLTRRPGEEDSDLYPNPLKSHN